MKITATISFSHVSDLILCTNGGLEKAILRDSELLNDAFCK